MPDVIVNKNGVFIDTHVRYRTISDNLSKQEYKFLLTTTLTISAKELFALQERHTMAFICVTISGCKGLWSDSDFKTDYWGDGVLCDCPECVEEVELDDYEYD